LSCDSARAKKLSDETAVGSCQLSRSFFRQCLPEVLRQYADFLTEVHQLGVGEAVADFTIFCLKLSRSLNYSRQSGPFDARF
jgi:hypothetical protein